MKILSFQDIASLTLAMTMNNRASQFIIQDHLQNLLFCEKARSASIFVAVCEAHGKGYTEYKQSSVAAIP
jgi:archaellum component FlaD/FlaE